MSSQKTDREEVFIEESSYEDQNTKGAFNSIFNFVNRKTNDLAEFQPGSLQQGVSSFENELFQKEDSLNVPSNNGLSINTSEIPKEQSKLQKNMHKSREIHRQLMNKKHRWRPSELELTVLKLHFGKNKYPTKEEKEAILKNLELNFSSTIDMSQLNRWFQHEREKEAKHGHSGMSKNTYKKFKQEDLEYLKEKFSENTYPKTEDMMEMAKNLTVNLSKIENWYKHNRRSLAKKGCFTLKTKKYFKKDEVAYLLKMFELYPRPTKEQILEMGQHLNCNELQIKNWYSNKRKKQKLVAKRQGVESQETRLHELEAPMLPQQNVPATGLFNNLPLNNPAPVLPVTNLIQGNEQTPFNTMVPNLAAARTLGNIQAPQILNPYTNQIYPTSIVNGGIATNPFVGTPLVSGSYPNGAVPVIIIPAQTQAGLASTLPLAQNGINGTHIQGQEIDLKNFAQPQQLLFSNNPATIKSSPTPTTLHGLSLGNGLTQNILQPTIVNQSSNPVLNYNFFKQTNTNSNSMEISGGNWIGQGQPMQQSNPIIIVNKQPSMQPSMQPQQMPFGIQGIQAQPGNFLQANVNPGAFSTGNIIPAGFSQNGANMNGYSSYEAPLQIQYLTSLYCPYSNNNIFSNYYPVVCQNNQGFAMAGSDKSGFGVETGMVNGFQINPQQIVNNGIPLNQGSFKPFEVPVDPRFIFTKNERDNESARK